jgi:hypothetical protein
VKWECDHLGGLAGGKMVCDPCYKRIVDTIECQTLKIKEQGVAIERLQTLLGKAVLKIAELESKTFEQK